MRLWKDRVLRRRVAEDAIVAAVIATVVGGLAGLALGGLTALLNTTAVIFWIAFLIQTYAASTNQQAPVTPSRESEPSR